MSEPYDNEPDHEFEDGLDLHPCSECGDPTDVDELIEGCCPACAHFIAYANAY